MSKIPRWQQGVRPLIHGDIWDAMTPRERRNTFAGDLIIAVVGVMVISALFSYGQNPTAEKPVDEPSNTSSPVNR